MPVACPHPPRGSQLVLTFCIGRSLLVAIFISLLGCVRPPLRQCVNSPRDSSMEYALVFTFATWFVWLDFVEFYFSWWKGSEWGFYICSCCATQKQSQIRRVLTEYRWIVHGPRLLGPRTEPHLLEEAACLLERDACSSLPPRTEITTQILY